MENICGYNFCHCNYHDHQRKIKNPTSCEQFKQCILDRINYPEDLYCFNVGPMECYVRSIHRFNWNGYICFPWEHIDVGRDLNELNMIYTVPNGISYNERNCIGFSTVMCNNYCLMRELITGVSEHEYPYYNFDAVWDATMSLANQALQRYYYTKMSHYFPICHHDLFFGKNRDKMVNNKCHNFGTSMFRNQKHFSKAQYQKENPQYGTFEEKCNFLNNSKIGKCASLFIEHLLNDPSCLLFPNKDVKQENDNKKYKDTQESNHNSCNTKTEGFMQVQPLSMEIHIIDVHPKEAPKNSENEQYDEIVEKQKILMKKVMKELEEKFKSKMCDQTEKTGTCESPSTNSDTDEESKNRSESSEEMNESPFETIMELIKKMDMEYFKIPPIESIESIETLLPGMLEKIRDLEKKIYVKCDSRNNDNNKSGEETKNKQS